MGCSDSEQKTMPQVKGKRQAVWYPLDWNRVKVFLANKTLLLFRSLNCCVFMNVTVIFWYFISWHVSLITIYPKSPLAKIGILSKIFLRQKSTDIHNWWIYKFLTSLDFNYVKPCLDLIQRKHTTVNCREMKLRQVWIY